MRKPSIAKLSEVFSNPEEARKIFEMTRIQLEDTPAGKQLVSDCHNHPGTLHLRMTVLNALDYSGLHGYETLQGDQGTCHYLNAGDTYAPTVIFWQGNYRVQTLGDFIEAQERRGNRFH